MRFDKPMCMYRNICVYAHTDTHVYIIYLSSPTVLEKEYVIEPRPQTLVTEIPTSVPSALNPKP